MSDNQGNFADRLGMFVSLDVADEKIDVINQSHAKASIRGRTRFGFKSEVLRESG